MKRSTVLIFASALSLVAAGCTRAEDAGFDKKVHDYIVKHPEVIEEAVQALQDKRAQEAQADAEKSLAKARAALPSHRAALEHDSRDFVANPAGRVTVTEFFDYRCPHCVNAAPAVLQIIKDNPDVRFVFKELPIFGAVSEHAARVAIAVRALGGDYIGLYRGLMATHGLDDRAIDELGRQHGVDPAKVEAARASEDAQIADVHKLAAALGVDGTPTFIVGDVVVPGEDMDALRAAIGEARQSRSS